MESVFEQLPEKKKTNRPLVLASVVLAMFMAAIEATIVATAVPSIVADIGGFSLFSWVFSGFLLMQAVTIPIYGKLADLYGRKSVFAAGVILFLLGSLLCGFARTMTELIVYRFIQGIGAGAVMPIATTIVGDIYTMEERGKIQGWLASVWGISSIIGPALGGLFVEYLYWGWVFWINLPIGVISIFGIFKFLHEKVEKKSRSIDYWGSGLLFLAISSVMIVFIQGGTAWPWTSWQILVLAALFAASLVLFLRQEKKAAEPVMPLDIWKNRVILVSNLASLTTGAVLIGISTYLPAFVQGVMERTPIVAGFTLAMMSIGWPLASTLSGRLMFKFGFYRISTAGGLALIAGSVVFVLLKPDYGPLWAGMGSFLIGVGMGLATTSFIVSIQSTVDWQTRGVATASNMFMRIMGNTMGVSLLGGLLNSKMHAYLQAHGAEADVPVDLDATSVLLDENQREALPPSVVDMLQEGLTLSLHWVYWAVLILSALSLLIILFMPKMAK